MTTKTARPAREEHLERDAAAEIATLTRIVLAVVILLAAALRLWDLGGESLWYDELFSWHFSAQPSLTEVVREGAAQDVHPPGHLLILYGVQRLAGDGAFWLRLPSAIAGVLTIAALYWLGRRLYGPAEGLVAVALGAVAKVAIQYSQEARPYALMILFAIVGTAFWVGIVRRLRAGEPASWGEMLGYIAASTINIYLHYYAVLLVGVQALHLLALALAERRGVRRWAGLYLPIGILYLPWMPPLYATWSRPDTFNVLWIDRPSPTFLLGYLSILFGSRLRWVVILSWLLYGGLVLKRVGRRGRWRDLWRRPGAWLASADVILLVWLLAPFVIAFVASYLVRPILLHRHLLVSLPAAYLLLARSLVALPTARRGGGRWLAAVPAALVVLYTLASLLLMGGYYQRPQKTQFREAVEYVTLHEEQGDQALIIGYAGPRGQEFAAFFDYYFERTDSPLRTDLMAGQASDIPRVDDAIAASQPRRVWYLHAFLEPDPAFLAFLQDHYQAMTRQDFYQITVFMYEHAQE
jgi:uncharacterized membrane protein